MGIQVLDPVEQMILGWTALYTAEERPLLGMILAAGGHMLPHGLLDFEGLATVRTQEHLIWCWPVWTMDSSDVLPQSLSHCSHEYLEPQVHPFSCSLSIRWFANSLSQLQQGNCSLGVISSNSRHSIGHLQNVPGLWLRGR